MEEGGQPLPFNQDYGNVESRGLRPKLPAPEIIRKQKVIVLSDSGAMIYRRPPKKGATAKVKPNNYLNNDSCADPWINIMANYEVGGADWSTWSTFLQKFVDSHGTVMEKCPDGTKRFPAHISVVVLDNLNGTNLGYTSQEANKSEERCVTLQKFQDDVEKQDAIATLMSLLDRFRSAIYCQTAPAKHWNMPEVVNDIARHIR